MNRELLQSACRQGYWIKNSTSTVLGTMNGIHNIKTAISPNTGRPLLRYCLLHDVKELTGLQFPLNFFFEWSSNISQAEFSYKQLPDSEIRILKYDKGGIEENFPYPDYPQYFPSRTIQLEKIDERDQLSIQKINRDEIDRFDAEKFWPDLCRPAHQIGGEPLGFQEFPTLFCSECGKQMAFLATFGNDSGTSRGYVDNRYVPLIFFVCVVCSVLSAVQHCD